MSRDGRVMNPRTARLKVIECYRECRDDADDVEKRPTESCLPFSTSSLEHGREQQGAQKEYVIETGPDVPDAGLKKVEKLAPERDRMRFELPGFVARAENRGMSAALVLHPKQSAVLRIDIEEERVFDAQNLWDRWAVDGEPHDLVSTVAVVVDQMLDNRNRAAGAIGGNHQPGQCVGSNFLVLRLDFPPRDLAVAIGIEPDRQVEVAQRDVPLPGQVTGLHREGEVAVARLVGMGRGNPHRQQQNQDETPHR